MSTVSVRDAVVPSARVDAALVHKILDARAVRSVYQPLVEIGSRQVVGFEALTRGPEGPLQSPAVLLTAADAVGRLGELDWMCRVSALRGVKEAKLVPAMGVFINIEPSTLAEPCPPDLLTGIEDGRSSSSRFFVEFTERAITSNPAALLQAVAGLRSLEQGVAVDDVGADPSSLALLPFLRPDVVKLDLRLVRHSSALQAALVANAVRAHVEQTGAVVLAEGIETEEHERAAIALGATHGQGWLYGRPGPLPSRSRTPDRPLRLLAHPRPTPGRTPFEIVTRTRQAGVVDRATLMTVSRQIEDQVLASDSPPVLLSTFQDANHLAAETERRYRLLSKHSAFAAMFGAGVQREPAPGVRGIDVASDDRLREEWSVIVVGPHFAAALVARATPETSDGGDDDVRFEHVVTYDRDLVVTAARSLLQRVTAAG